ncbi:endonuclease/exonuclease/phosphatase family protein, partial [Candidatus Saccharibacteria bacterium]|nr:endonuclease/exonuclease/phosphatase family protein [Candidatus Saccharibacteria bacterium]
GTTSTDPYRFKIATYNTLISVKQKDVVHDVRTIKNTIGFDVIALQENYSDSRRAYMMKTLACDSCSLAGYTVNGRGKEELMIFWKKSRFELLQSGSIKTSDKYTERGRTFPALHLNYVRLKVLGTNPELQIIVADNHLPSLVDRDDDGKPNWKLLPKRVAAYQQHMANVNAQIKTWKSNFPGTPIFIGGDYNVNYRKDKRVKAAIFPTESFAKVGGKSNWQQTSFDTKQPGATTFKPIVPIKGQPKNRLIDYVYSVDNGSGVTLRSTVIRYKNLHSDHHAVRATYELPKPAETQ